MPRIWEIVKLRNLCAAKLLDILAAGSGGSANVEVTKPSKCVRRIRDLADVACKKNSVSLSNFLENWNLQIEQQ